MSQSSERHAREAAALAGKTAGISRELVRQAKVTRELAEQTEAPALAEVAKRGIAEIMAGRRSQSSVYNELIGDDRVPLYLKLPAWLDERLREIVEPLGQSRQQFILSLIEREIEMHDQEDAFDE